MGKLIQLLLYLVILVSSAYFLMGAYALVSLWEAKAGLGVIHRDLIRLLLAMVLGVGVPYCMIVYIKKEEK